MVSRAQFPPWWVQQRQNWHNFKISTLSCVSLHVTLLALLLHAYLVEQLPICLKVPSWTEASMLLHINGSLFIYMWCKAIVNWSAAFQEHLSCKGVSYNRTAFAGVTKLLKQFVLRNIIQIAPFKRGQQFDQIKLYVCSDACLFNVSDQQFLSCCSNFPQLGLIHYTSL